MDGGIEFLQAGECHSLYFKVNGTVEELHGIFYQSLVLGVTHTGGTDRTTVIFGKSGKIIIDDRLVAVASCDGSLQVVGDDSRRNAFKILHGILTCFYQVFLALRPHGFAVGIMAERKDGDKHLGFLRLACHFINDFKPVADKINIHLVTCIMLDVTDDLNVKPVFADNPFEGRQLIALRIFGMILLEQFSDTCSFACQTGYIPGKQGFQFYLSGRRFPMTGLRTTEDLMQLFIGKRKKLFNTFPA